MTLAYSASPLNQNCIVPVTKIRPLYNYPTTYYLSAGKSRYFVGTSQGAGGDINTQQTFTPDIWYAGTSLPTETYALIYHNIARRLFLLAQLEA